MNQHVEDEMEVGEKVGVDRAKMSVVDEVQTEGKNFFHQITEGITQNMRGATRKIECAE